MKKAFTLAEVLTTLAIIGIVAALTLPTFFQSYKDRQFKTAYKKAYSDANASFKFLLANDEYIIPDQKVSSDVHFSQGQYSFGDNLKTLSKYFKTERTCFNNDADKCFDLNGECGVKIGPGGCLKSSYAFTDITGRQWYMYSNTEVGFIVDTNGFKKPNQLGKDRFHLSFPNPSDTTRYRFNTGLTIDMQFVPNYKNHDVECDNKGDMTKKQRWCPQGNCYYRSWLLD